MSQAAETAAKHIDIGFVRIGPTDVKSLIVFVIISLVFLCVFSALMTPDEEEHNDAPASPKPTRMSHQTIAEFNFIFCCRW